MAAIGVVQLRPHQRHFAHPYTFTSSELGDVAEEDTTRGKAAQRVQEAVLMATAQQVVVPHLAAADLHREFERIFTVSGVGQGVVGVAGVMVPPQDQWMARNELLYIASLLEHHLVGVSFNRESSQTAGAIAIQIVKALICSVTTVSGDGSLRDVFRPWDMTLADIEWEDTLVRRWTERQLAYCFRVVVYYYTINVESNRTAKDIFQYRTYLDEYGLSLFTLQEAPVLRRRDFSLCLRNVYSNFARAVQEKQRQHEFQRTVEARRGGGNGGDGGGGGNGGSGGSGGSGGGVGGGGAGGGGDGNVYWSAGALYVFTAAMRKHIPDDRLYERDTQRADEQCAQWEEEGYELKHAKKLYHPLEEFTDVAREMQQWLGGKVRCITDVGMQGGMRSDFVEWAISNVRCKFVETVAEKAPHNLILATRY